jgi:hypothetical protein
VQCSRSVRSQAEDMTRVREWGLQDRPLNTVHFESPSHTTTLLGGLNTLRTKGLLLDVTLVADGQAFQVLHVPHFPECRPECCWLRCALCNSLHVRFPLLQVFRAAVPSSQMDEPQCFAGTSCLHLRFSSEDGRSASLQNNGSRTPGRAVS